MADLTIAEGLGLETDDDWARRSDLGSIVVVVSLALYCRAIELL